MGTYTSIESHRGMVFDTVRNSAYAEAIRRAITPGCRVLDLGAGLGIHGLLAATAGAGKVILLDPSPAVDIAAKVARQNGLQSRVKVIRKRIEEATLDSSVDIIVSVFTGNFLLTEDLLPSLFRARDLWLAKGGTLLPGKARMHVALVQAKDFYEKRVAGWSQPVFGLDYSAVQPFAANTVHYAGLAGLGAQLLTEPGNLAELDFYQAKVAQCKGRVELKANSTGTVHGILGWFDMQLGDHWISTGPGADPMHWSVAFLPLDPPLDVQKGQVLEVSVDRPEFGEWTWAVRLGNQQQRHSTFFGSQADLRQLKQHRDEHVPGLGIEGEVALFVLRAMQQGDNVAKILSGYRQQFSAVKERDPQLEHRIRHWMNTWGDHNE